MGVPGPARILTITFSTAGAAGDGEAVVEADSGAAAGKMVGGKQARRAEIGEKARYVSTSAGKHGDARFT
jgi:hypothetical protein